MAGLTAGAFFSQAEEESSARRLDQAQQGMAEASWPKKPDDRLSPLSGKMKEQREMSVKYYGQEKEVRTRPADGWGKRAPLGEKPRWVGGSESSHEEARWGQGRDWSGGLDKNRPFQPDQEWGKERAIDYREMERKSLS